MIIDAHQHFWQLGHFDTAWLETPEHAPIRRDFLPEDLKPHLERAATGGRLGAPAPACSAAGSGSSEQTPRGAGVDGTVFVQTQHDLDENRWALGLAEEHPFIRGIVGWVDLASEECEAQLLEFKEHPRFVGIRHLTQNEPDDDFILRPEVLRGLKVLQRHQVPFDLLFYVKHLKHAATLGRELPELKMVIDHLAKPHIKAGRIDDWEPHLRAAARCPNIYCKLSGMVTEANWNDWKPADLKPYIDVAWEAFGPERLMFGSDWPVCELAGSYQQVLDALNECLGPISEAERTRVFGGTAIEFYGLPNQ